MVSSWISNKGKRLHCRSHYLSDCYKRKSIRIYCIMTQADSLDNAGWNVDILHWDDISKFLQTVHILDLTAELGAVENKIIKCRHRNRLVLSLSLLLLLLLLGLGLGLE